MKLWLISWNPSRSWEVYTAAIVAAETQEQARSISPDDGDEIDWKAQLGNTDWATSPDQIKVRYIGEAKEGTEQGVILVDYRAA